MSTADPFETTLPDGPAQSSLERPSGLSLPHLASWAQLLAGSVNQLAAIGAVIWGARDLIALAATDARPLLGAGVILTIAAIRARPKDLVAAILAWRKK